MKQKLSPILFKLFVLTIVISPLMLPGDVVAQGEDPLSSLVAVTFVGSDGIDADNAVDYVKQLVDQYRTDTLPEGIQFPLANAATDNVRALQGFNTNVVISWLDPLTWDDSPDAPRFGANNDYIAYFGEGWNEEEGAAPQFRGSGDEAWLWVNHEYISGDPPTATTAPIGQHETLADFLFDRGVLDLNATDQTWGREELTTYTNWYKRQLGGSWMRIVKNPATHEWVVDRSAANIRYDATSNTLLSVVGQELSSIAKDDAGEDLPEGVVPGIMADCSGGQTPWGTIFTAEENVQDYYGDLEACWSSRNAFIPEEGCDAGGPVEFPVIASETSGFGQIPDPNGRKKRDFYGYLVEIDPGVPPMTYYESIDVGGAGIGHRKLGALGRARWENVTLVVDENWQLIDGQPIVLYAGNDRRDGRVYKFVTAEPYAAGMSTAEIRALLDDGTVYVAHFAGLDNETGYTVDGEVPTEENSGVGEWLELSIDSEDIAPNAIALDSPEMTIGEALQDNQWNNIGSFASDNDVRMALFTAANKVGVKALNRPEDVEWNANDLSGTPRLYVVFTKHGRPNTLDEDGVLYDPATHDEVSPIREDSTGSIFVVEEADPANPAESAGFTFWAAWVGTEGTGPLDVANPDNMMLDADGGVWFGTDGNFGVNGTADGLYYLDMDPTHATGTNPTYGVPFRVIAGPSDSEATGPALSADMGTIFFNVQHPGEDQYSNWPHNE